MMMMIVSGFVTSPL